MNSSASNPASRRGSGSPPEPPEPPNPREPRAGSLEPQWVEASPTWDAIKLALKPLASLRLTVVLFGLGMFLVLAGTLAQVDYGIWEVMDSYFRTPIAWIELQVFMPNEWAREIGLINENGENLAIPFPGGYILGGLMIVNLVAAHAIRFKVTARADERLIGIIGTIIGSGIILFAILAATQPVWPLKHPLPFWTVFGISLAGITLLCVPSHLLYKKRTGIVLLHAGVIILLINEAVTGLGAVEGRMEIPQQGTSNYVYDLESSELAFSRTDDEGVQHVIVVPESMLAEAYDTLVPIDDSRLPVILKVVEYMPNSTLVEVKSPGGTNPATRGRIGQEFMALGQKVGTGVDGDAGADTPSAYITFIDRVTKADLGTFLFSVRISQGWGFYEDVTIDGKAYKVNLQFAREYKPYSIHLIEFRHDKFTGTDKPRNFSSEILLFDEDHPKGRKALIKMNAPLRYRGETFFQAAFLPGDRGTILQVVRNPGYLIPYIGCTMVAVGMTWHFILHLIGYVRKAMK